MSKVGVIDYGSGNIFSLARAVEKVGFDVFLISSPEQMSEVDRYILPGVGAFGSVMQKLEDNGFNEALISVARQGKPLLGICVGMQVLFDVSHEFGEQEGLGGAPGGRKVVVSEAWVRAAASGTWKEITLCVFIEGKDKG